MFNSNITISEINFKQKLRKSPKCEYTIPTKLKKQLISQQITLKLFYGSFSEKQIILE